MTTVEETAERITRGLTYPCYIDGKFPLQWYRSEPTELKEVLARVLPEFETKVREEALKEFEDRNIEVELNTKQCLEVAKMVYEKYEEAMKPPVFAVYSFPDWLQRGLYQESEDKCQQ